MKRDDDKRLIIPKDAFEEEASEGLGRLNRDEAAEDLRDLERRMAQRLRKPRRIWIPAAAAVIILLIASTVYIGLFRERQPAAPETAMVEESQKDTVLIAMAEPVNRVKAEDVAKDEAGEKKTRYAAPVIIDVADDVVTAADEPVKTEIFALVEEEQQAENLFQVMEGKAEAEEVIVEMLPERAKAAQAIPVTATESKAAQGIAARTEVKAETEANAKARAAKDIAVADREKEYRYAGPDHAPRPAGGMEEMNRWVSINIRYPAEILPRARQQVIVSFIVRADSSIYGLKADSTPGDRFTEEALRLLREGPKWEPAVRNGTPVEEAVRVSLIFK